ncbi:hypothetical protein Bbelb_020570 [Branchiostoma belcheri]|nr:hypothetical protein Bbelb_020570 [Branchiostoma belcheri]
MEGNDRQQANKDNITRPTNLENTTATSSANVVRTVEPQTERLPKQPLHAKLRRKNNVFVPNLDARFPVHVMAYAQAPPTQAKPVEAKHPGFRRDCSCGETVATAALSR